MTDKTYKRFCCLTHSGIDFTRKWNEKTSLLITMCKNKMNSCEKLKCLYAGGNCDPFPDVHKPVHSDFLVNWTGLDIDKQYDPNWEQSNDPKLNADIVEPYINRLKNILKYGLWMTSSDNDQPLIYKRKKVKRETFSRTCFTELKLSETRIHAKRFGRLGIGVKRPFVMRKKGAPVIYYREEFGNWFFASFENSNNGGISIPTDAWWAYYLKSMNEGETRSGYMQYKNFDESEWRVIFSEEIHKKFGVISGINKCPENDEFYRYLNDCKVPESKKPQYLLPLDKWFSIIIYPSLAVKVRAESDKDIRDRIKKIKPDLPTTSNSVTSSAAFDKYSKPSEINLDACRNF